MLLERKPPSSPCAHRCAPRRVPGPVVLPCGLLLAGQKCAIKPAPRKHRPSEYTCCGPWLYHVLSGHSAAGEEAQHEASQGLAKKSPGQRGVSTVLAKAKHGPRSLPSFLLVSCNTFLPHSKWCRGVCTQPPTSPKCFAMNEAGNLKRSVCNLEIQGCITGQANNQGILRLSLQSRSQCVRILTAYLSSLIVTSRAAGEPIPVMEIVTQHAVLHRVTLAAHPTWLEFARSQPTTHPSLGPPPQAGAAAVAQRGQTALGLLGWGYRFVTIWEGRGGLCCSAALRMCCSDVL